METDPRRLHAEAPINQLLDPNRGCRRMTDDVAIHWYPQGARPGDTCHCGESVMREPEATDG